LNELLIEGEWVLLTDDRLVDKSSLSEVAVDNEIVRFQNI